MKLGNSSRAMGVGVYFLKVFWRGGLRGVKLQSENVSEHVLGSEQVDAFL